MVDINWTNVTDFATLPSLANTTTNGTFWIGMLHMLWVILILVLISFGFEVALIVSTFLALILAFLLVYADLINWIYLVEFAGILLFIFLYIMFSGRKDRTT